MTVNLEFYLELKVYESGDGEAQSLRSCVKFLVVNDNLGSHVAHGIGPLLLKKPKANAAINQEVLEHFMLTS